MEECRCGPVLGSLAGGPLASCAYFWTEPLRPFASPGWTEELVGREPVYCLDMGYLHIFLLLVQPRRPLSTGASGVLVYVTCLQITYVTFLLASYHHLGCHDTSKSRQRNVLRLVNLQHFNYELQRTSYERYFGRIGPSCQRFI
jgi:hypothetical protein